jgi:non-homologous end joining protein Ku
VIAPSDVEDIPRRMEVGSRELRMAHSLIESLEERFRPEVYRDEFRERVEALASRRRRARRRCVPQSRRLSRDGTSVLRDVPAPLHSDESARVRRALSPGRSAAYSL